jgi:RNA polymerase sigma factor (sigma-70 family)
LDASPTTRPSLLLRLRDPDDARAWDEFVAIYGPLIWTEGRRMGLQPADSDDLAQEVFARVVRAMEHGGYEPGRGSFRGWLFRISRNLAVDALVARARRPRGSGESAVARLLDEAPAPSAEDSAQFATEYRRRLLAWAAGRVQDEFSPVAWSAFWATAVESRPVAEVAASLAIGVGSVYNARSRAMARIRREIDRVEGAGGLGPVKEL